MCVNFKQAWKFQHSLAIHIQFEVLNNWNERIMTINNFSQPIMILFLIAASPLIHPFIERFLMFES